MATTYDVGNPAPVLGQKQKYGNVKWWSSINYTNISINERSPLILTVLAEHQKTMATTFHIGNPAPGMVQKQRCGRVKPVNRISTLPCS